MLPFFWLQLWVTPFSLASQVALSYPSLPLRYALIDCDSLLRHAGLRDTVTLFWESRAGYRLEQTSQGVRLYAGDTLGWVYGLYGLLQEKWGFVFAHPQVTVRTKHLSSWQVLEGVPRFAWRGFHLHTQHPIELTEPLHDPSFPGGEQLIRAYIDWLIRNGQNYFEFCLLGTVDFQRWLPYFRRIVGYAQARGVAVGIDLSLRMQQQRAYQLLPRYTLRTKRRLLKERLTLLASTGISRLNVDLNAAEFVGKDWGSWIDSLVQYAQALGIAVMSRQHVVPPQAYAVGHFQPTELPPALTLCVHSVMCYGLRDTLVPVYRCKDFSHLSQAIQIERQRRKVWYYPETAYWVTFDNSVPVWLLSYLRSRWEDMQEVEGLVEGHLTFSSGWDVGYWFFDWSVARWSWRYYQDEQPAYTGPEEGLLRLFGGDTVVWKQLVRFQDSVLVGKDVLSYITPTTPIDEIGWTWLPAFQPRLPVPPWRMYRRPVAYRAMLLPKLEGIEMALERWPSWPTYPPQDSGLAILWRECQAAWELTRLRVTFRYYWLAGLLSERESPQEKKYIDTLEQLLQEAPYWVKQLPVRYPFCAAERLCRARRRGCKHPHPSYRFGYLYPAVSLHFWRRELDQLKEGYWEVWYQNIWDIPRITGLW